jgi:hypothetical protein
MEKAKLTFMPDGNNTYAGFDGAEIVALVTPYDPEGLCGPPTWQWCARSERDPYKRLGWAFPDKDGWCVQRERELEDAARRAAQYIGHGGIRPMGLCPDDCPDCPTVVILPPKEVDR